MHGLRKRCPALPGRLSLEDTLAALRRGQGIPVGQKVLIVLDQFEQWLQAKKDENSKLVQALRQCDGGRVQCIVMLRDDFWMAAFGRAFGTLPDNLSDASGPQKSFIKQSVAGLAESKRWTVSQRVMMSRAFRVLGLRSGLASAACLVLLATAMVVRGQIVQREEVARVEGLVGRLASVEPSQLSQIVEELDANPEVAAKFLTPLVSCFAETNEANRRFRAAVMLADYLPESNAASWTAPDLRFVAGQLIAANAEFQPLLREYLRPIRGRLLEALETIFGDSMVTDAQRLGAANAFADYAESDIANLSQLLVIANMEQYGVIYPLVAANPAASTVENLGKIAATLPATDLGSVERVPFGQHRASAAVTLLRLGEREKVLPVFDMTDDPEALTQFIFRCRDCGVRVEELLECLRLVSGDSVDHHPRNARYALLLALGEYTLDKIPRDQREPLLKQLSDWYRQDPSSGVHGAAGWLLRQWGQDEFVLRVDQTPIPYSADREWFTLAIPVTPTPTEPSAKPLPLKTFYYTFIVFPAGDFEIGSFGDEPRMGTGAMLLC